VDGTIDGRPGIVGAWLENSNRVKHSLDALPSNSSPKDKSA